MKQHGSTIIELVIAIILLGISAAVLLPLLLSLRHTHHFEYQAQARQLAQQRMEIILQNYNYNGFSSFTDPCQGSPYTTTCPDPTDCICNVDSSGDSVSPSGFTLASNIITDVDTKTITVTVTGKSHTTLITEVTNYK